MHTIINRQMKNKNKKGKKEINTGAPNGSVPHNRELKKQRF